MTVRMQFNLQRTQPFIRELNTETSNTTSFDLEEEVFALEKIHTNQNSADMLTMVVTVETLKACSVYIGLQTTKLKRRDTPVSSGRGISTKIICVELELETISKWESIFPFIIYIYIYKLYIQSL